MSKKKTVLISVISVLLVVAIIVGILFVIKGNQKSAVNVYNVGDFAYYDDYNVENMSYGWVKTDRIQSVYVSDTQEITETFVSEGQQVKKGDKLLSYDTTLTDLELQKKDVEIQRLQMNLQNAQRELSEIRSYKPYVPQPEPSSQPEPAEPTPSPLPTPSRMGGSGTAEDPYLYLWDDQAVFSQTFMAGLFEGTEETEIYAQFYVYESNSLNMEKLSSWGMIFQNGEDGYTFTVYTVEDGLADPAEAEPSQEPLPIDDSSGYTAKEIAQMISDKESEIKTMNISLRVAQVDYKKMEKELSDGCVVSDFDGVVVSVLDEETAYTEGVPIVKVSGGGGYLIDVAIGEFALGDVSVGQEVAVNGFETGMMATGVITAISTTPTTNIDSYSDGNGNISYYPVTVSVEEDAGLMEDEYASVVFDTPSEGGSNFCLDAMFIRSIDGKNVAFVEENGKLVKREVVVGKTNWSGAYEIRSGLTMDDYISFPYGAGCKEGSATRQATSDELYNW